MVSAVTSQAIPASVQGSLASPRLAERTVAAAQTSGDNPADPVDEVSLSADALKALEQAESAPPNIFTASNTDAEGLTEEEQEQVKELKQTDQEVRQHEQSHKNAAGPYGGAISYETVTGPDGREYAVAGRVDIDLSPVPGNPEATIRKMEIVERAALAPAEPSPEDMQVARAAQQARQQAQAELAEQQAQEREEISGESSSLNQSPLAALEQQLEQFVNPSAQNGSITSDDPARELVSILFSAP